MGIGTNRAMYQLLPTPTILSSSSRETPQRSRTSCTFPNLDGEVSSHYLDRSQTFTLNVQLPKNHLISPKPLLQLLLPKPQVPNDCVHGRVGLAKTFPLNGLGSGVTTSMRRSGHGTEVTQQVSLLGGPVA